MVWHLVNFDLPGTKCAEKNEIHYKALGQVIIQYRKHNFTTSPEDKQTLQYGSWTITDYLS